MTQSEGLALQTANPADRVALRGVRLVARVAGLSCKATLEQTFVNLEPRPIEAVYTFPLPEHAAVCGFEVVFFDKVFTGVVDETDRAIRRYDDAVADGHGAYLLEQHRPDVFTVRVGNLNPRQAVTVRLTYVTDVPVVDRQIRLAFPTTIAPRYQTASGTDPIDAAIDGDALNPPHVLSVPYGLTMEIELDLGKALIDVQSPTHAIRAERTGVGASAAHRVTFAGGLAEMDRDVVLALTLAKEQEPFALAATSPDGEKFVALNFLPEFDETEHAPTAPTETVFLLDCSGSMQGPSIAQATAALECCLRSMSAGDTFNVCRFGSSYELLSPEPLVYSQETLARALTFVRQPADLGGTELLAPLQAIFEQRPASNAHGARSAGSAFVRNVVLLTDGQVSNEPAIVALARRKRSTNRVFTFGIGTAASAFLVKALARVTGGEAEFIAPGERIEEKVLRTFGRLASPPVTDVEIDWGDADADAAPRALPPLFDGDALRVFARVPGKLPDVVTLKCNTAAGPRSWSVRVRHAEDPANVLPTLWARAAIRHLEEVEGVQPTATISGPAADSRDRARLLELSKRYNLLCGLTSFVAVEHRSLEDRNTGQPATRRIPTKLALGWGGVETSAEPVAGASAAAFVSGGVRHSIRACATDMAYKYTSAPPPPPAPSPACVENADDAYMGPDFMSREELAARRRSDREIDPLNTIDKTLDKTIDKFKDSLDRSMDKSVDRSIDKSIDMAGMDEATANDPTQAPIIKLVQAMIAEAVRTRVSDIHIEPMNDRIQVRYRIDGALVERDRIPLRLKGPLLTRLKIMAGMNVLEKRLTQDGRIKVTVDGADVHFHASTLPTSYGESVLLRVLSPAEAAAALAPTGPDDALLHLLVHQAADGSFDDSAAVEQVVRSSTLDRHAAGAAIDKVLHDAHVPSNVRPNVRHTLLVLLVLHRTFADRQPIWSRAAKKALRYVTQAAQLHPGQADQWLRDLTASPTPIAPGAPAPA
jgi:Ca-activated chloride channel family protein